MLLADQAEVIKQKKVLRNKFNQGGKRLIH